MEKEFYEEIAKRCLDSGVTLPYFIRDVRLAITHEAMIRSGGVLRRAASQLGVKRETLMFHLGMGSREWNDKYGDEI